MSAPDETPEETAARYGSPPADGGTIGMVSISWGADPDEVAAMLPSVAPVIRDPARLTFPAEPTLDGTRVRLDTDGHADGAVYVRMAVEAALPPKATRRWRPIAPPSMWAPEAVALGMSYATWPDLLVYALTGSLSRCELAVTLPNPDTD